MPRDPLDAALTVLIDEALSVRVQLREHRLAREAMRTLGVDPDVLAAEVDVRFEAATDALDARESHVRRQGLSSERSAAFIAEAAAWTTSARRTLRILRPDAPAAVDHILQALPVRLRDFRSTPATLREAVRALTTWRAAFGAQPLFTRVLDGAADLLARVEAHEAILVEQADTSRATVAARAAERKALQDTLRLVRRVWKAAQTVNGRIGELDLRLAKGAIAQARRRPAGAGEAPRPAVDPPAPVAPPIAAPLADPPGAALTGALGEAQTDPACDAPTLRIRRVEELEMFATAEPDEG